MQQAHTVIFACRFRIPLFTSFAYESNLLFIIKFFIEPQKSFIIWISVSQMHYRISCFMLISFYAPTSINWGHIVFCPSVCPLVHLSMRPFVCPQTFTLANLFIGKTYFTWVYLVTSPFCCYQVQGHQSRSNIKVTVLKKKMAIVGALVFHIHSFFFPKVLYSIDWY